MLTQTVLGVILIHVCLLCRQEEEEAQIELLRQEEMHQKRLREEEATRRKAERMRAEMIKVRGLPGILFAKSEGEGGGVVWQHFAQHFVEGRAHACFLK